MRFCVFLCHFSYLMVLGPILDIIASSVLDFPPGPVTKPQSHFLLMHGESNDDEDNDDIYIMMKCVYVCLCVTFLLILPSPSQADDIYIMMRCVSVCLCVCHALAFHPRLPLHPPLPLVRARAAFHYTFDYKPLHLQHIIMMMMIVKMMMID